MKTDEFFELKEKINDTWIVQDEVDMALIQEYILLDISQMDVNEE